MKEFADAFGRGAAVLAATFLGGSVAILLDSRGMAAGVLVTGISGMLSVFLLNRPRIFVIPAWRSHPGAIAMWVGRARNRTFDWEPTYDSRAGVGHERRRESAPERQSS